MKGELVVKDHCSQDKTIITDTSDIFTFPFVYRLYFLYHWTFTSLAYGQHSRCRIENRNCLPFTSTWIHPWFYFWNQCCSSFQFSMLRFLFCVLFSILPVSIHLHVQDKTETMDLFGNYHVFILIFCRHWTLLELLL